MNFTIDRIFQFNERIKYTKKRAKSTRVVLMKKAAQVKLKAES